MVAVVNVVIIVYYHHYYSTTTTTTATTAAAPAAITPVTFSFRKKFKGQEETSFSNMCFCFILRLLLK
jgi:hypothetical protein